MAAISLKARAPVPTNGTATALHSPTSLIHRDKMAACRSNSYRRRWLLLHKNNNGRQRQGRRRRENDGGPNGPPPCEQAYWKSFRIACVDWLAIESDCTPSCCCTCSAWSLVDATFKSASTSEPTPLLSEVCRLCTKED